MTAATGEARPRIAAIDILRGLVMVLMSIDHVRVFSGLPAGGPTAGLFFTRWITNFCAPAFVFFAGTSAFLYGRQRTDLPRFLLTRGLWLVILELTVVRWTWAFNLEPFFMAGVLWAIGWSMVFLALLVRFLSPRVIAAIGIAIIAGHNLMDPHLDTLIPELTRGGGAAFWKILYFGFFGGPIDLGFGDASLIVLYSLVPWVGVISAGYGFGTVLTLEPSPRHRVCLAIGLGAIAAFCLLRGFNLYGDPRPWQGGVFAFLNTVKYPASLAFLLMTLGPTLLAIPIAERCPTRVAAPLITFGRVPLFYYLLHIPLIHVLAMGVSWLRLDVISPWLFTSHPMGSPDPPAEYIWSLPALYAVTLVANAILYGLCRWYARLKASGAHPWLRYL